MRVTHGTRRGPSAAELSVRELWAELSATMRQLRLAAGMSLRQAEAETRIGRGTLSQFETAKARPNRHVVEWYDTALGGDGLLLSIYAEARGAHGPSGASRALAYVPGDALAIAGSRLPYGAVVECGTTVTAGWTLHNTGTVAWRGRRLERVGARAGIRLITSAAWIDVDSCDPRESVDCIAELGIPSVPASYAGYWQMIDEQGRVALPFDAALCVQVVGRESL